MTMELDLDLHPALHAALPAGFSVAATRCGIKHARDDLAVLVCAPGTVVAGCVTQNPVRAACIDRNADLLPSADIRAVVVVSGNANALTGAAGVTANDAIAERAAELVDAPVHAVLTASTGVIGVPLDATVVHRAMGPMTEHLGTDPEPFARAILTTDTGPKAAQTEVDLADAGEQVTVVGMAKGSGMIHPNMATTLGFVCTDAAIAPTTLDALVKAAVDDTFNAITVDGDTSTNDMVLVLASGQSGAFVESPADLAAFDHALRTVLRRLAMQVAADGEGATRLLEVTVTGAPDPAAAKAVARGVCGSNLVKCSAFAGQPDHGRVAAAVGQAVAQAGLAFDSDALAIAVQGTPLWSGGQAVRRRGGADLKRALSGHRIGWEIAIGSGPGRFTAYGCDLSYDYVRINADDHPQIEISATGTVTRNLSLSGYSPRLKHQLLVEGLAYVRRFSGLRLLVYVPAPSAARCSLAGLAEDLALCLDAGLKPLCVVPHPELATAVEDHARTLGHPVTAVGLDATTATRALDRGHLAIAVEPRPDPLRQVDLGLRMGVQKLVVLSCDRGLCDDHGLVGALTPEALLGGLDRDRFRTADPEVLTIARHAATLGLPALHVIDGRVPHALVGELFTDQGIGTLITRQAVP